MQHSLSFTIPYTSSAIRATVVALNQMDNDLNGSVGLFTPSVHTPSAVFAPLPEVAAVQEEMISAPTFTPPPPSEIVEEEEPAAEGAVDANGMQWDERIHASTKTFVANGTWKMKRGVDKAIVDQVVSELMGNVDTTPTQSSASTPLPPVEAIIESTPPPPTGAPTAPSAEATVPNPNAFRQLLSEITKAGLAPDYVQKMCMEVNGRALPLCKDDMGALDALRMALGL